MVNDYGGLFLMELNVWARRTLIEAYEKVYNDSSTTLEDARKIKRIIQILREGQEPVLVNALGEV